jgi:hypothetical protein
MTRAPYTVRLATGLIVTALEESRKLPTQLITMPMTAVSNAVQAGMRLQQNVAEMVIKGDSVLDGLFNKPEEQPAWAKFDEDDEPTDVNIPVGLRAAPEPAAPKPAAKPAAPKPAAVPDAASAPIKKAPAKKAPAKKAAAKKVAAQPTGDAPDTAAAGRFALYSSVPAGTEAAEPAKPAAKKPSTPAPEVAEFLDYDNLTLAQLRAKIRTVDVDDLRVLADYERSARNRTPFVTMLENRITAKSDR